MNVHDKTLSAEARALAKADPTLPCLIAKGREVVAIRAGTTFRGVNFAEEAILAPPHDGFVRGLDYAVQLGDAGPQIVQMTEASIDDRTLGGFHFAPGGNALARGGGDSVPAINSFSLWDIRFRPACDDPRGMTLVEAPSHRFWCDIYLLGASDLVTGSSKFGVIIADGNDRPLERRGKSFKRFDHETAVAVMARHGKSLLSIDEFFAAAFGVTEKTSHDGDPGITGLDAPRTSKWGLMQATGSLWVWGHDGDPDEPRASFFGGSWWIGGVAGSRCAGVGCWPGISGDALGARGRSDHLQLA